MIESGYYPLGAEFDQDAPWNQCDPKPIEREIIATFTLSTSKPTSTTHYYCEGDKYEGYYEVTDDTDWSEEYHEQHHTPLELIELFKKKMEEELETTTDRRKELELKELIEECSGWECDFADIYED